MGVTTITLKAKKDQSVRRMHPWVFSGAIKAIDGPISEGKTVEVRANKGGFLGWGHYSPNASIAVRMISYEEQEPDAQVYHDKIESAFNARKSIGLIDNEGTNIYRLVHAEGDGLPGLIIDVYDKCAVVQSHSVGMHLAKPHIVEALKSILGDRLEAIFDKSADSLKKNGGFESENGYLWGSSQSKLGSEYGCKFNIDWEGGQKTGFFVDQRENRKLLGDYSKGKKVLNTFCYTGGFSAFALKAGATEVHSLDSSQRALDFCEENMALNDYDGKHKTIKADAVEYMKEIEGDYDIIILDPPAFAKHKSARHQAVQGYKRLNSRAIEQIKPGGMIFTFSCSQAVDKSLFTHTVISAAMNVGRKVRILHQLHQPADHPINAFHPEGEYLKGLVIQVD